MANGGGGRKAQPSAPAKAASISPRVNQRASSSSAVSTTISRPRAPALQPIIRDEGNGQGWLATYSTLVTSMPASSWSSRATAASSVSLVSTKPASAEKRPGG